MSDRPNASSIEPRPRALMAKMAMLDAGHADDEEVRRLVVRAPAATLPLSARSSYATTDMWFVLPATRPNLSL